MSLQNNDPKIFEAIQNEVKRQEYKLELIASENYVSQDVLEAAGSVLTNKYAEGYPEKRYYGGCEFVDVAETLAISRAKELFQSEHVNVQPHSGSQANMAVYLSQLKVGDTILGMNLSHGGHLTHGSSVNFSGQLFNVIPYGVNPTDQRIDFDQVRDLAKLHKPKMIVVGASAYPREIPFKNFRDIADEVGAMVMTDMAHIAGLVATGIHNSPIPCSEFVTTTTHKTLRGPRGGMILSRKEFAKSIDSKIFPGIQGGPLMHIIAAKAVAFKEALSSEFLVYQQQIVKNSKALAATLLSKGLNLVTNGTDNHLVLIDLTSTNLTGKEVEYALGIAGITVNKNTIPFETRSPFITSGIRIGTPAITTRGMKEGEMKLIGSWIVDVIENYQNESKLKSILEDVNDCCRKFPIYSGLIQQ